MVESIETSSFGASRYLVPLLDEFRCYSLIQILNQKSMASDAVHNMMKVLENTIDRFARSLQLAQRKNVKRFRFDGGDEYLEKNTAELLENV